MSRPAALALVAVVSGLLGGVGALVLADATDWIESGEETVVIPAAVSAEPVPAAVSGTAARPLARGRFDPVELYRQRAAGVVTIFALYGAHAEDGSGAASQGSGFVVSKDGYILTNSHVVTTAGEGSPSEPPEPATQVFVQFRDGDRVEAEIVGWDVFDDVAVLRVDPAAHALSPLPLGNSDRVVVGEPVATIGSPFGRESSLAVGVVSATERAIESLTSCYSLGDAIQTDAPINRGNSGGPMFDARGDVIGINAQIRSASGNAEGVGFAVPINTARRSLEQLIATGRVRYAWVGISTQTLTPSLARRFDLGDRRGALVQSVVEGSPAEDAGLRGGAEEQTFQGLVVRPGGDVILAIGGRRVGSADDVVRAISGRFSPGDRTTLTILRDGARREVDVVLAERPALSPGAAC